MVMTDEIAEREWQMVKKDSGYFNEKISKEAVCRCEITIPFQYTHERQMEIFYLENYLNQKKFSIFSIKNINDYNYRLVTDRLIPGETYVFELYSILKKIHGQDCLDFLCFKESLMTGVQGLTFLWSKNMKVFTPNKYLASFDKETSLRKWRGSRMVPFIYHHQSPEVWDIAETPFEEEFNTDYLLLVVYSRK